MDWNLVEVEQLKKMNLLEMGRIKMTLTRWKDFIQIQQPKRMENIKSLFERI